MTIDNAFFEQEERCGFIISAEMKKIWAVQLDLLDRFQEVCHRHNLTYFASGGTLLGAIRHKGYIPWDDDIDILMLREDYDKLLTIAAQEFTAPYFLQTAYNDPFFSRGHAQLRNSNTTGILTCEHGLFPFNQGIFIDIFPADALPDDLTKRRKQIKRIRFWEGLLKATVRYPANKKKNFIKNIAHALLSIIPYRPVYRRMEQACIQYNRQGMRDIGLLSFMPGNEKLVFPACCFDHVITVPFEYTTIDVPANYEQLLTHQYGDFMTMKHEASYHGGMIYDTQRSYIDYLQ